MAAPHSLDRLTVTSQAEFTQAHAIAKAIKNRKQRNETLKASKNPLAKFESRTPADERRRRMRDAVRKHRAATHAAAKLCPKKRRVAKPTRRKRSYGSAKHDARHIPVNCCGRRKNNCICFAHGRGLEISRSFKREQFQPVPAKVRSSRIQSWRDTADMPAYKRQIGWNASMRYSWLFPIAFMWRHFSNEQFWDALQDIGAVIQNQQPDFILIEKVMRAFQAKKVSYHGGLFFSACALQKYRFGSTEEPEEWQICDASHDFITKEILALKVMWHVANNVQRQYDSLQRNPTRQCWKACTKHFLATLQEHTKGCFAAYSLKIALDGVLISQPCLEKVVSWWPMECTAYVEELPKLYPECAKNQDDLFIAACHFHQCLKTSLPKFKLNDSLAQTCWIKRGVTGKSEVSPVLKPLADSALS